MEEKLIKILYNFFKEEENNTNLLDLITLEIHKGTKSGAEMFLDWCRDEYDNIRTEYMNKHNISEDEMERILEDNFGSYEFMYDEIGIAEELEKIWDLCNWYLDYIDGSMTKSALADCIDELL